CKAVSRSSRTYKPCRKGTFQFFDLTVSSVRSTQPISELRIVLYNVIDSTRLCGISVHQVVAWAAWRVQCQFASCCLTTIRSFSLLWSNSLVWNETLRSLHAVRMVRRHSKR